MSNTSLSQSINFTGLFQNLQNLVKSVEDETNKFVSNPNEHGLTVVENHVDSIVNATSNLFCLLEILLAEADASDEEEGMKKKKAKKEKTDSTSESKPRAPRKRKTKSAESERKEESKSSIDLC